MLEQKQYEAIQLKMDEMKSSMVDQTVALCQRDPNLLSHYALSGLREIAQQGVNNLAEMLMVAVQINQPEVLADQLKWVQRVQKSRQIDPQTLQITLQIFRARLRSELPEDAMPVVVEVFDQALRMVNSQN